MGCKLNLQKESDNNYVQAVHNLGKIIFHRVIRPWTYANCMFYLFSSKGKLENRLLEIIHNFTNKIIKNREENFEKIGNLLDETNENNIYYGRKKLAMLDLLLNAKVTHGSIDDKGIKDEVNTIMFEVSSLQEITFFEEKIFLGSRHNSICSLFHSYAPC